MTQETCDRLYGHVCPRMHRLCEAAEQAAKLDGEFWECGTLSGNSARLLAEILRENPRPLRLFDTFSGFTGITEKDQPDKLPYMREGYLSYPNMEAVRKFVNADFATLHKGAIPNGFTGLENSKIAFAYIDVDLYKPTRDALLFILPRVVKGGIIIIDDCGAPGWPGVEEAVREVVVDNYQKTRSWDEYHHDTVWQGKICL